MKNTKENILKLLEAKEEHLRKMSKIWEKEGANELAEQYKAEAFQVQKAIWLFTDKDYFNEQYKILIKK